MIHSTTGIIWLESEGLAPAVRVEERCCAQVSGIGLVRLFHVLASPVVRGQHGGESVERCELAEVGVVRIAEGMVEV